MVKTRNKQLFGLVIPILILLAVSMYFTYISLQKYLNSERTNFRIFRIEISFKEVIGWTLQFYLVLY